MSKKLTLLAGCLALGFSTINAADSTSSKADDLAGWPQVNGPTGNFVPRKYGCTLIDDLKQAKAVWTSEDNDLGYGKTSSGGGSGVRSVWPGHPGSANGLIAAEGKIFAASFRPVGEQIYLAWVNTSKVTGERLERLKNSARVNAEDFVIAIDQNTGKTVWKTIEPGGINRAMGKRGGWCITPAYYQGRVFSLSTVGRLYCHDAKDGKRLWASDIGPTHQRWLAQLKEGCEKQGGMPGEEKSVSLVVADGVLIVPLYDTDAGSISLRGVAVADGKTLWELKDATSRTGTPAVWRHQGREYLIAGIAGNLEKRTGKVRLIDPQDGKVLWTIDNLGNNHFALAPSDQYLVVNVRSEQKQEKACHWMRLGCYEISLTGAKLLWTVPDTNEFWIEGHSEASDWRKYMIRDGKVYFYAFVKGTPTYILDAATGKVLASAQNLGCAGQTYFVEDRILVIPDASHTNVRMQWWSLDLKPIGSVWAPPHKGTTGYNVFMEFPYVNGRIFMRALEGTVRCYDLRAAAK
ncbi:MAG: PQQ-binding-like beta-propeller repeat protein [bacterium]